MEKKKGFDIGVVTVDDIYSNYSGDLISGIYDDAGKVRQYLSQSYAQGGTMFALLAGDYNTVPIRYGNTSNNEPGLEAAVPADLYFADFNGDWEVDGDEFYGEREEDNLDYYNEIYVSRLLCNNNDASNISNWVNKVLIYELNPGNGDYDYLTRNLLDQADAAQADNYAGGISSRYPPYFANTIKEEIPSYDDPNPTSPTGSDIVDLINTNKYGLFSFNGHGTPKNFYILTFWDHVLKSPLASLTEYFTGSGGSLEQLNNNNYPMLLHSVGCEVMPFDELPDYENIHNMGESFTILGEYGGPSMIGNTRLGSGYSIQLFYNFLNSEFPNPQLKSLATTNYSLYSSEIGYHFWKGKSNYVGQGDFHYIILSTNLLGCPQTEFWRSTPQEFENISITDNGSSISVNTNGNDKCLISVVSVEPSDDYQEVVFDETSYTFNTSIRPLQVTISKHYYVNQNDKEDYIPFIGLTGFTLTDDLQLNKKLSVIGNIVIPNNKTLTLGNNSELYFSAGDSIIVNGELIIEPGAKLKFKDMGKVVVNNRMVAEGTTENPIIFDQNNSSPGFIESLTSNSIIEVNEGAQFAVTFSEIKNGKPGIVIWGRPEWVYVQDCEIHDCTTGILLGNNNSGGTVEFSDNEIYNNNVGIDFLRYSEGRLLRNEIHDNSIYGVKISQYSNPTFGYYSTHGNNVIINNSYGVYCYNHSDPILGIASSGYYGYNYIYENSNYALKASNYSSIVAENNYWGTQNPSLVIYTDFTSSVDFDPYLMQLNQPMKNEDDLKFYTANEKDNSSALLRAALNNLLNGNYENTIKFCKRIIEEKPDEDQSLTALNYLYKAFLLLEESAELNSYLLELFNTKIQMNLYAYAGLLYACLHYENQLQILDEIISNYPKLEVIESVLFEKFLYHIIKNDYENAVQIANQLQFQFPESISAIEAKRILNPESVNENQENMTLSKKTEDGLPTEYKLFNNYPNPFNPTAKIKFTIPSVADAKFASTTTKLVVYDILGREIIALVNEYLQPGIYEIEFNAKGLTSGVYYYRIESGNFSDTKKMILLK